MKARLLWTSQAREDLLDIYVFIGVFIGADNPDAAERLYTAIVRWVEVFADSPRLVAITLFSQLGGVRPTAGGEGHHWPVIHV